MTSDVQKNLHRVYFAVPSMNRRAMTILFLHGWQSVSGWVKPTYLREHGHIVINPQLPDEDFTDAVRIVQAKFDEHQPDVVVEALAVGLWR